MKENVQKFGRFLSGMVMPNIGAFIAWGFIAALFIADGWLPNAAIAEMVSPMLSYLLPLLIGYTGGRMVADQKGAVTGAIATLGVIVGVPGTPMFIGAMIAGPLGGWCIKQFDKAMEGHVPAGFEMLVNNFSVGIIGGVLSIVAMFVIGPACNVLTGILSAGVTVLMNAYLLPLTAIRGNAEGIVCGLMNPQTSANVILAEADRLAGFVEDILYLSRMGRAAPEDKPLPLDLRDILSLCVSEQRVNADALSFSFDFDETPVLFAIRERDARQLFGNLISNAIRYAVSAVRLSCHAHSDGVWVRVSDDGPGITSEDLPHIFERFYKGAGGKHGIGLSIARTVVDAYRGDITAQNDGGAVFTVSFPVESPAS